MNQYIILHKHTKTALANAVNAVNEHISKGWEPIGGVSAVSDEPQSTEYLQAMVHD
jgi:hypothetical protein